MRKKGMALLLALSLCAGSLAVPAETKAAEDRTIEYEAAAETEMLQEEQYLTGGLLPLEYYEEDGTEAEELNEELLEEKTAFYADKEEISWWNKYKSYYFYNKMTAAERDYWDDLETLCDSYLLNNAACVKRKDGKCRTKLVASKQGLTLEEMKNVIWIFRYNNPQYYFLNNAIYWNENTPAVGIGIYPSFYEPADRARETAKVKTQLESWEKEISALNTDEEKACLIHDLIIRKVEYNHAIYEDDFDESTQYTQSSYSVLCTDLTVCAGYSQAFSLLCSGAGIDAVCVTSPGHEWNKVRLNDSWYNVDCTWDDKGGDTVGYYYLNRNDAIFDKSSSHAEKERWLPYLPICSLDSGATVKEPGSLPAITEWTQTPVISAQTIDGKYQITITAADPDAEIYYTTDGSIPDAASVKSWYYKDSFVITEGDAVQAIAVKNAHWDSEPAYEPYQKEILIAYDGNGATSGTMSSQLEKADTSFDLQANAFVRTGYQFAGWNTKSDGTGRSYADGAQLDNQGDNLTLYAQWLPVTYAIVYELNNGTAEGNPTSYNCTQMVTWNVPTRRGYTFMGWYEDAAFTKKTEGIAKGTTGDKKIYAGWRANRYRIRFDGNGSDGGSMQPLTELFYDETYVLSDSLFTRTNQLFVNWNTKADGSGSCYAAGDEVKNLTDIADGEVVLYAQWKEEEKPQESICEYKIIYQLNGGKNHKKNPSSYTKNTSNIKLQKPTRTGYTFKGWYSNKKCTKKVTEIKKGSAGDKIFYAKWQKKKYKIAYKLNGGKNAAKNPAYYYVTSKTITLKEPKKNGYAFQGWYTDKKYKKKLTKIKKGSTGNLTIYAKWKKK